MPTLWGSTTILQVMGNEKPDQKTHPCNQVVWMHNLWIQETWTLHEKEACNMKKKRREFYQKGLQSWLNILDSLEMASNEGCPVCDENPCLQYQKLMPVYSKYASDCPLRHNPELCSKLRELKHKVSNLAYEVKKTVHEIQHLHEKAGILPWRKKRRFPSPYCFGFSWSASLRAMPSEAWCWCSTLFLLGQSSMLFRF